MRQVCEITAERPAPRESVVTIRLRSPEAARALNGSAWGVHLTVTAIGATALSAFAWQGGLGESVHGFVRLTLAIAGLHWISHTAFAHWQRSHQIRPGRATVRLNARGVTIHAADREPVQIGSGDEVRFASRPHWLGREEEREERRVHHPVGYEFRDAWEVWCEAGLDVIPVAAVSGEDDARAIVRRLTEEYLFVTRGDAQAFTPKRTEPA